MPKNPFYLKILPVDDPGAFCDREIEISTLLGHARSGTSIVLSSPRRFGKTSLVRRVQHDLAAEGAVTIYCDLFGVLDVEEVAKRIARAVFTATRKSEGLLKRVIRAFSRLRPVFRPDAETGMSVSVESARDIPPMDLLEDAMQGLGRVCREVRVHAALDEFQEITEIEKDTSIQALMRGYVQEMDCSFFFVGSRRRILQDMFSNRKLPFYKSALDYQLGPLPAGEAEKYLQSRFKAGQKRIEPQAAEHIVRSVDGHPYYIQIWAQLLFENTSAEASLDDAVEIFDTLLEREKTSSELQFQGLTGSQKALIVALAKEPARSILSASYMSRHNLKSVGGTTSARDGLVELDLIERDPAGTWRVVDPLFRGWMRRLFV